jgi:nitroimidazol reductase NimA-like FMN-containing flavoprotein (pyridoxamine 5'-phosphate oxidase superfamily)
MIERMKELARESGLCVLATASGGGTPHCSLMAYTTSDDCTEIYMTTYRNTTKFRNLMENPAVSLLIDTRADHKGSRLPEAKAMTVSGLFELLEDGIERKRVREMLLKRHPQLAVFLDHPDAELIRVKIQSFLLLEGFTDAHFEEIIR